MKIGETEFAETEMQTQRCKRIKEIKRDVEVEREKERNWREKTILRYGERDGE